MTIAELDAELASIQAKRDEKESRLLCTLGEEAYRELLDERKREWDEAMARAALIEVRPEWNEYGFDVSTLTDDEFFALLPHLAREMLPDENQNNPN